MAYGHAERNLAPIRQLEAETRKLLGSLDQPDPEQSAWLQEITSPGRRFTRTGPRQQRRLAVLLPDRLRAGGRSSPSSRSASAPAKPRPGLAGALIRRPGRISTKGATMATPKSAADGSDRLHTQPDPHTAGTGGQAAKLKDMTNTLQNTLRHHPVVLEQQAQRAQDVQLRIADWITAFAGSMNFVYIHIALFTLWMLFIESKPWPTLTLIVSLEAIFLSTFVMIGQNRQGAFQQAKADHDFTEQELELKTNTQLTREIHALTTELHNRLLARH